MAVSNIVKGYFNIPGTTPIQTTSTTLNFTGAFSTTVNATFTKIGQLIVLNIDRVVGIPIESMSISATLPPEYAVSPLFAEAQYSQLVPLISWSIVPDGALSVLSTYPGSAMIAGNTLTIFTLPNISQFVATSPAQGTANSISLLLPSKKKFLENFYVLSLFF